MMKSKKQTLPDDQINDIKEVDFNSKSCQEASIFPQFSIEKKSRMYAAS